MRVRSGRESVLVAGRIIRARSTVLLTAAEAAHPDTQRALDAGRLRRAGVPAAAVPSVAPSDRPGPFRLPTEAVEPVSHVAPEPSAQLEPVPLEPAVPDDSDSPEDPDTDTDEDPTP